MPRITVISSKVTVYTPRVNEPYEIEATPRVRDLVKAGVFIDVSEPVIPKRKKPAPVIGVTSLPGDGSALVSPPLGHEGDTT